MQYTKSQISVSSEDSLDTDENGMLTGSGPNEITAHYIYDESGQLIRTNDRYAEATSVYEYDSRGNMISKKLYDYTTGDLNGLAPKDHIYLCKQRLERSACVNKRRRTDL